MLPTCQEVAVGARWALSLDHGREGAAASWEAPTGSPLPAIESPPGPPRREAMPRGWTQSFTKPHLENCCGQPPA